MCGVAAADEERNIIQVVNDQGLINMGDELCVLPYVCTMDQMSAAPGAYRALD